MRAQGFGHLDRAQHAGRAGRRTDAVRASTAADGVPDVLLHLARPNPLDGAGGAADGAAVGRGGLGLRAVGVEGGGKRRIRRSAFPRPTTPPRSCSVTRRCSTRPRRSSTSYDGSSRCSSRTSTMRTRRCICASCRHPRHPDPGAGRCRQVRIRRQRRRGSSCRGRRKPRRRRRPPASPFPRPLIAASHVGRALG